MGYKWLHSSAYSSIPPNAIIGGNDSDGAIMYVGRSFHNGDMLVAKVLPSKHIGFVSWRGEEIPKDHFEMLCGESLVWRHCYDHVVPENAVECGKTSLGQSVYIGRGHYEGSLTVGKISSVHRALFIPFGGTERRLETYEILVDEQTIPGWAIPTSPPPPPLSEKPYPPPPPPLSEKPYPPWDVKPPIYTPMPQPSLAEKPYPPWDAKPPPMYNTAMAQPPPSYAHPPVTTPAISYQTPAVPYQPPQSVTPATSYQPVQVGTPAATYKPPQIGTPAATYQPTPICTPAVPYDPPPPYVPTPPMYAPMPQPSQPHCHDMWVSASPNYTPSNAVHAGHDTDMSQIFVSRAFHDGYLVPGKAIPSRGCSYVSFSGQEIPKSNYEVLVGHKYHWVQAQDGNIAQGAVEAGRTSNGEPLFVGRAHYNGSLTPGKIQQSHQCLYIAFGGNERRINHYEVLVSRDEYYRDQAIKMHY